MVSTIETIDPKPFKHLIMTIGELPSSFVDSMSYYEMLAWLCDYLEKQVVPVVNNNSAVVAELKEYVENYFDNLDVQEEINNKLDAMAEAGTLQEIITSYIQANVAWTFNTVADMKLAENLVNGSYARTLGFRSINDGGGALYKITNSGTANELDVIAVGDLFATIVLPETVTPEMFGAYGDGTHDDTDAWNKAVSVNRSVKAFEKTYLVSTIEVTDTIDIDCGNASFVSSSTKVFNIHGEVVTSLANENDYTADDIDYAISNTSYTTYTGMAFVHGDNNFETSRDYYRGGFAATFENGKLNMAYPIPVTSTVIDIVTPISGSLKNIKAMSHQSVTNSNRSIVISYANGYEISDIRAKDCQAYIDIDIQKSINVNCHNLNMTHNVTFSDDVSYIVMFEDSSFCELTDSYLYNKKWHAVSTSGIYLCYGNSVTDSTILSDYPYSFLDHANALGTTLDNLTANCVSVCGLSYVNNVRLHSAKDDKKRCNVGILAPAIEKNAIFTVSNIMLNVDAGANGTYCGIYLYKEAQIAGGTYYFKNIKVSNVKSNKLVNCVMNYNLPSGSTYVLGHMEFDDCWLDIRYPKASDTQVTITDAELVINNFNEQVLTKKADIGIAGSNFKKLVVNNSSIRKLNGTCDTVILNNVYFTATQTDLVFTNIYASNLQSRIDYADIKAATIVNISNMQYNATTQHFNFVKANGTVYYQEVNTSTGLFETKTIA